MRLKPVLMWTFFTVFWVACIGLALQVGVRGFGMWMTGWLIVAAASVVSMHFCHDIHMDDRLPKLGKWWAGEDAGDLHDRFYDPNEPSRD